MCLYFSVSNVLILRCVQCAGIAVCPMCWYFSVSNVLVLQCVQCVVIIERWGWLLKSSAEKKMSGINYSIQTCTLKVHKYGKSQRYMNNNNNNNNKQLISNISHVKICTWLRKGNLKRKTESLLIAAQNNVIRTNHIKMQLNSKCRLCGNRDETINHIISKCRKLAQKEYKTSKTGWAKWSTGNCARN